MARPHQGIAQHVPEGEHDSRRSAETGLVSQRIRRKAVLIGLINEYSRAADGQEPRVTGRIIFSSRTGSAGERIGGNGVPEVRTSVLAALPGAGGWRGVSV